MIRISSTPNASGWWFWRFVDGLGVERESGWVKGAKADARLAAEAAAERYYLEMR